MTQLQQVIEEISGNGAVLSIQPGGNYGDYLIYKGFNKIITNTNAEKRPFGKGKKRIDTPPSLPSNNVKNYRKWLSVYTQFITNRISYNISAIYIHGGGNFNDLWRAGINCFRAASRTFSCPIIVGPQSCIFRNTEPRKIFESVDNETHFFCREEYSYDIIERATTELDHVTTYLSQDTALYLNESDLYFDEPSEEYSLVAMRADKESAEPLIDHNIERPILIQDISITANNFNEWVNLVAKSKKVYTDRLHVAILSSILNKSLFWYEASYHKSKGVYEYSLSDEDNIKFYYV